MADADFWERSEAERLIHEVFDKARARGPQLIHDANGKFELRFIASDTRPTAAEVLAQGGPGEE